MIFFHSKISFLKNVYIRWQISNQLLFFDYYGHGSHVTLEAIEQVSQDFKLYVVILRRLFTCLFINDISSK
jgi:hypothetical protein